MLLQLESIKKTYSGKDDIVRAVDDLSLELNEGDFVGVQGPSGCGKTTLLLIAGGLLKPDGGKVLLGDQNPYALPPDQRAQLRAEQIGFVFQQFHLVPYLNVRDNILAASLATTKEESKDRVSDLIKKFGLENREHHVPAELSTGERQRTALARALMNRPKILLADEPTGNLDRENADIVLNHFAEFAKSGAVLLVSHDDYALKAAGQVRQIREGKLIAEEPVSS